MTHKEKAHDAKVRAVEVSLLIGRVRTMLVDVDTSIRVKHTTDHQPSAVHLATLQAYRKVLRMLKDEAEVQAERMERHTKNTDAYRLQKML